ncbi:MAG: hypothetical protein ACREJM_04075, partial [Candidatus Saccharimonadales bacterium]
MFSKVKYSGMAAIVLGCGVIAGQNAVEAAQTRNASGVHISFVDQSGNPASQLYVLGDKVRLESGAEADGGAIYDAHAHTMTVLMPARQAYMVLDKRSAAEMGARMRAAEKQIQARMSQLPPEQRAMMEKLMAGGNTTGNPAQITVKDLGSSETVAGHRCKDVQMVTNGKPGLKMCVASMSSLDIPADDAATLNAMRIDMMQMMSSMGPMAQAYSTLENVEGFAIKRDVPRREGLTLTTSTETLKSINK